MRPNRVFFPQALLDTWIVDEHVEISGNELTLRDEGRRYRIEEGYHIVRDVAGIDPRSLVGKVKTRAQLDEMSAELFEGSLIVGDAAYDINPGFVGEPIGPSEHPSDTAEDELLAQFLLRHL